MVINREGNLPAGLFAHSLQTQGAKTLYPQSTTGDSGVVGRIFKALQDQAAKYDSITADRTIFRGSPVDPVLLSSFQGMLVYKGSQTAKRARNTAERKANLDALKRLAAKEAGSIHADTHNQVLRTSLSDSEHISALLEKAKISTDWESAIRRGSAGRGQRFVAQFEQVSRVIAARKAFDAEVDVFYVELGGFDTHSDMLEGTAQNYKDIDVALDMFVKQMKTLGVWENVVVQSISEFGRTMTSNGQGTDHAYGGNQFIIGGNVRGGIIHGEYPEVRINGPQSVSTTGVMLPSSPWEKLWTPISLWLGVEEAQLDDVMPNLLSFKEKDLLTRKDMFVK